QGDTLNLRHELNLLNVKKVVGWIGRMVPVKGCEYFLRAAKIVSEQIDNVSFVVVGDGELLPEMKELSRSLGIDDRVIFTGDREDPWIFYRLFDVFVLTSLNEGLGRVLIEAMAAGTPIVATDVGGVRDVLKNGDCGILVPSKDVDKISSGICKLLIDKEAANNYIKNGLRRCKEFKIERTVKETENLYLDILKSGC
ncbi:MAG: glycosyltransferase family 4 protein, partial [Fidelibacterota bacterium]